MTSNPQPIDVMFRKYRGNRAEILAVFPYEAHDPGGLFVTCYATVGQHGSTQMEHVLSATRPARPDEFAELYRELEGIYERAKFPGDPVRRLRIIRRRSSRRSAEALQKARR